MPKLTCNIFCKLIMNKYYNDIEMYYKLLSYLDCYTLNINIKYIKHNYRYNKKLMNKIENILIDRKILITKYLSYNINEKHIINIIVDKYLQLKKNELYII